MADRDENPGFKVKDRRMFNADGSKRDGAEEPAGAEPTPAASVPPKAATPPPKAEPRPAAPPPPSPPPRAREPEADPRAARHHGSAPADAGSIDFSQFVMSMAQIAVAYLGELPNPQTGRPQLNLPAAKQQIDLLGMLEEKTRGNLTHEEAELLKAILTELRLHFVEVREAVARGGQPPRGR